MSEARAKKLRSRSMRVQNRTRAKHGAPGSAAASEIALTSEKRSGRIANAEADCGNAELALIT